MSIFSLNISYKNAGKEKKGNDFDSASRCIAAQKVSEFLSRARSFRKTLCVRFLWTEIYHQFPVSWHVGFSRGKNVPDQRTHDIAAFTQRRGITYQSQQVL
jgi:hypothetical protein